MASRQISFDSAANKFQFGGNEPLSFEEVGSMIGAALASGTEVVEFGVVRVTVNYLTSMMRFARKWGWFNDQFSEMPSIGDHDFDNNQPTPGFSWGEVVRLRASIRESRDYARRAAVAQHPDEQHWTGEADSAAAKVDYYLRNGQFAA